MLIRNCLIILSVFIISAAVVIADQAAPREFDGYGIIDRITDKEIVLEDLILNLAEDVEYFTKTGRGTLKSSFKKGVEVAYVLDSEGLVISLWFWR